MSNNVTIEHVDNGYIVETDGVMNSKEVFTTFAEVVNAVAFEFSEIGVGEDYIQEAVKGAK